jgi:Protein of unknown function (DUF1553)/Protein of unknown function (DUF1549)/Planctomycete cytochrome C
MEAARMKKGPMTKTRSANRSIPILIGVVAVWLIGALNACAAEPRLEFNRDVRPILSDKCFACHGPDGGHRKANLRLDIEEGARTVVSKGHLVTRITSKDVQEVMPPPATNKQLSAKEIDTLRRWIEQGAPYEKHWTYAPPRRPTIPVAKDGKWGVNAVDSFILAKIEAAGLKPAADADPATLIRRLTFDLTGLPPTIREVDEFNKEYTAKPQAAFEALIDRLLASPRFGERMAIYWLDLVRFADTVGYHGDQEHPIAPYRDYVIKAFNENKPFDQFTIEQLAGDLLPDATIEQKIATGYNRVLQTTHEGGAQDREYRAKYMADRVRNLGSVWLGATLGCSECHNHKFDPYTQRDFYRFQAFFADIDELGAYKGPDASPTKRPPEIDVMYPLSPALKTKTMITRMIEPRTIRVLRRGDWLDDGGDIVAPGVPAFLPAMRTRDENERATRLDLANWLVSPDHPQTSRIFVNRLWYLFFGAGLCRSLEDTGSQGEWPTHPDLLDYLASEFVVSKWDVKRMVKLIVSSRTYRQSSAFNPQSAIRNPQSDDPENRLVARQNRFRLPAEMIRDNALSVSGLLVEKLGGPSARPYQPAGYYEYLNFPKRIYKADANENQYRRGLYVHWQRQFLHPMLKAFDAPSREECTVQRPISNTPLQALTLLNDPSLVEAARGLALRIVNDGGATDEARIRWVWKLVLSREASEREVAVMKRLVDENRKLYTRDADGAKKLLRVGMAPLPKEVNVPELAAWTMAARTLLNLNEAITRN